MLHAERDQSIPFCELSSLDIMVSFNPYESSTKVPRRRDESRLETVRTYFSLFILLHVGSSYY